MKEILNNEIYNKLNKELKEFKEELVKLKPEDIINRAYEITIKEEIVDLFGGYPKYDSHTLKAILQKENALHYLYDDWYNDKNHGISERIEDNMYDTLEDLTSEYESNLFDKIEQSPNYELILDISEALLDFDRYELCYKLKRRFDVEELDLIDINDILNTKGGKQYLYDSFNELKNNEQLEYLNEISVINSTNYNNIDEKILPKLKELIKEEKNKERDARWNMIKK